MDILEDNSAVPAPKARIDYRAIAEKFNGMEVGKTMRLPKVYNITSFRRNLENRVKPEAINVYQRDGSCFIKRLTSEQMQAV